MIHNNNIPQGYKQTELGIIPEDWAVRQLGDCVNVYDGTHQTPNYVPVGIPFYSVENVTANNFLHTKHISPNEHKILTSRYKIQKGDILMTRIGSIGVCKYVDWDVDASFYVSLALLKPYNIDALYLSMASNATYFKDSILLNSLQFAIPQKINLGNISNVKILVPPIAEQRAIAEALSDMDGLIAALDKKIAKKRLLKQGAMQQLLTGKKRLLSFTDEWVSVQLKEICSFQNGYTPSKTVKHFWENGTVPWFRMEDIRTNGRILYHAIQHVTNAAVKGDLFPAGSIIMSTTATIGEHALLIVDSLANQQFTNLIIRKSLDKQVDTMWFYHYCYILGEWCRNNINDGGLAAVNMDDFSNVHIILPPILEQQAIATILSDMDKEIADLEAQRDKYCLLKSGMMQKLLTGQIRLKTE